MKFGIITYIMHREHNGKFYSYAPYISEMNGWLNLYDQGIIAAPKKLRNPSATNIPYADQIIFCKIPSLNFTTFRNSIISVFKMPKVILGILKVMRNVDHIHLRCPGNISLIGCFLQIFFPKKPKTVKYAGNWDPAANQPLSYKLQKWILSNTFLSRNIKVLVYGDWPNQSKNILPFFTASFSEKERELIQKDFKPPYKFVFTGNLVAGKGVFAAVNFIKTLKEKGVNAELDVYGDGILNDSLNDYIRGKELQKFIKIKGRRNLEELKRAYKEAHFVILLSKSEGWPKAIAEGMWHGCVPVVTPVSCVPWMLNYGERGILIFDLEKEGKKREKGEKNIAMGAVSEKALKSVFSQKDISRVIRLIENSEKLKAMSLAGRDWSQQYTLEKFEREISEILANQTINSKPKTPNYKPQAEKPTPKTENQNSLRVLQLIDSLRPGGAEKMAVNIANALSGKIEKSYLCATRQEGALKNEIDNKIGYLFLGKKTSFDINALLKLRGFIKREKIEVVQAHGTSWFFGVMLKLSGCKIKLIWHDHYGESENLETREIRLLKPLSAYFDGVIAVNPDLKKWAEQMLKIQRVICLNNFITPNKSEAIAPKLRGSKTAVKIVCVANIRPQKDHFNLLKAFEVASSSNSNLTLHLIGEDPGTSFSKKILNKIKASPYHEYIFYYGIQQDVPGMLAQVDLGILSSRSEGLPLVLLEYGSAGLPVICTDVGQCAEIIGDTGELVKPQNAGELAKAILKFATMKDNLRLEKGKDLKKRISNRFTEDAVVKSLLEFYEKN